MVAFLKGCQTPAQKSGEWGEQQHLCDVGLLPVDSGKRTLICTFLSWCQTPVCPRLLRNGREVGLLNRFSQLFHNGKLRWASSVESCDYPYPSLGSRQGTVHQEWLSVLSWLTVCTVLAFTAIPGIHLTMWTIFFSLSQIESNLTGFYFFNYIFLIYCVCAHVLCAQAIAYMWRSEENRRHHFSSTMWDPWIKLRPISRHLCPLSRTCDHEAPMFLSCIPLSVRFYLGYLCLCTQRGMLA